MKESYIYAAHKIGFINKPRISRYLCYVTTGYKKQHVQHSGMYFHTKMEHHKLHLDFLFTINPRRAVNTSTGKSTWKWVGIKYIESLAIFQSILGGVITSVALYFVVRMWSKFYSGIRSICKTNIKGISWEFASRFTSFQYKIFLQNNQTRITFHKYAYSNVRGFNTTGIIEAV